MESAVIHPASAEPSSASATSCGRSWEDAARMGDEFPIREVTAIARRAARQVFNGDHITQQDLIQEGVIASWRAWDTGKRE